MKYVYITALIDFHIQGKLKSPLEIKPNFYITNNPDHTAGFMSTADFITIGSLEATPLTDGSPVLYKVDEIHEPTDAHTEVINFLREAQAFLTALWFHKDNSANCELGFAFNQEIMHVHSNAIALHYTHHTGEKRTLSISQSELLEVRKRHSEFLKGIREQDREKHTSFRSTLGRVDRGFYFLQQARATDDLGQKIASYCSFFESVLSTSATELSHQLSERSAFFVGTSPTERLEIFRRVKKAYSVRSKIVHGDVLNQSTIRILTEISESCDNIARAISLKILGNEFLTNLFKDGTGEAIDEYMLNQIFGIDE